MIRLTFSLLLISWTCHAQIGSKALQNKIVGIWQNTQFGAQMTLMLHGDGSGEFDGESIRYTAVGNSLSITMASTTTTYTYTLQGNSLTLSGGDLDGQVQFTRNESGISESNAGANSASVPAISGNTKTSSNVLGLWSGNGEMIEFKADAKCVYLGNTFPYQVLQGHIILTTGQGNVNFAYAVKGTQLILTANGQNVIYNKVEGYAPATATEKGKVALELVGTWCYMNMTTNSQTSRCITLNGDGSYLYHSEGSRSVNTETLSGGTASQGDDRGTWYIQGDRIYYNSPTTGQGSFRLEKRNHPKNVNDPMIVLDGEPYVTTTLRNPWR